MDEFREYITFYTTTSDGIEVEMAVVDEFEFKNKNYVAAAVVEGDTINDEAVYIYKIADSIDFVVEKITNRIDYEQVAAAYMEMAVQDQYDGPAFLGGAFLCHNLKNGI